MNTKNFLLTLVLSGCSVLSAQIPGKWQAYFFEAHEVKGKRSKHATILPEKGVISLKGKNIRPETVSHVNGLFDLDKLSRKRGGAAVLTADMKSEKARKTWLGVGGLIFSCRVNGKKVYDITWKGLGNDYDPVTAKDHIFEIELEKGSNKIVFETRRTSSLMDYVYGKDRKITWHLAVQELPDYKPAKAELAHPEILVRPDTGSVIVSFITVKPIPAGIDYRVKGSRKWLRKWDTAGDLILREKTRNHTIRLDELEPGKEYEYRLVLLEPPAGLDGFRRPLWSRRTYKEVLMPIKSFKAFGNEQEYSFFLWGDTQLSLSEKCKTVADRKAFMKKMSDIPAFKKADFMVQIGDMDSYYHDVEKDLFGKYLDFFAREKSPVQWVYVRGNHEVNGIGAEDWYNYFQMPGDKSFYSFTKGDVMFIVLDCGDFTYGKNTAGNGCLINMETLFKAQKKWLEKLRKTPEFKKARFRVVLAHPEPQIESSKVADPVRQLTAEMLADTSKEGMIHLWLAGHVHRYWRANRGSNELIHLYPARKWALSKAPVTWVSTDAPKGNSAWPDFSYLGVDVKKDRMTVTAYDVDGKKFDSFSVDTAGKVHEHFLRKDMKRQKLTDKK